MRRLNIFTTMLMAAVLQSGLVHAKLFPGPVDACSFYKSIWKPHFMTCAEPKIRRRVCTKTKGSPPLVIRYKGDRSSMYLPDYLIEVTAHWGRSIFEGTSELMKNHMEHARTYYATKDKILPSYGFFDNGGEHRESSSHFWHARLLIVPGGSTTMTYPSLKAGGGGIMPKPICFSGISEYYFDQWNLGIADLPFAMAWAPIGIPVCHSNVGAASYAALASGAVSQGKSAANDVLSGLGIPPVASQFTNTIGCAYPVPAKMALTLNLNPSSDALNFTKMCMGSLGNLLPREGTITAEDRFRSALMAAWRFSSLVNDVQPMSFAGIDFDDKWQLVYPRTSHGHCFRAGSLSDFPTGPWEYGRGVDANWADPKTNTYVFAIWKKRETNCQEPGSEADGWKQMVKLEHKAIETGICKL